MEGFKSERPECRECNEEFECHACWEARVVRQRNEAYTEIGNLRALLTEARERLMRTFGYGMDVDGNLASRIDAALKVEE